MKNPPLLPIWRPEEITLQPVRSGFPCFAAAVVGYVEATRSDDDEKNRLCPPSRFGEWLYRVRTRRRRKARRVGKTQMRGRSRMLAMGQKGRMRSGNMAQG
jgi:hypothetical protein